MKTQVSRCFLLVLALAVWGVLPAAAQRGETGGISGRVTSETGEPVSGARVEVLSLTGQTLAGTLTDRAGNYRVENLPPGSYTVRIGSLGFAARDFQNVQVSTAAVTTVNVDLVAQAVQLNPIVVSASRRTERLLDAPARVEVVGELEIEERPVVTPVEHLRAVPGVDIATHGLQSTNVVARGFNNIFSGALYALTDHRLAGVPSLRANLMHFVPATNEDMERMEVVLGPGSALYGPNTANGVLHIFTRSPLSEQGTVATLGGGERSVLHGTIRTSHLLTENVGIKVSGEYLTGQEWPYTDPVEEQARLANPNTRIGVRDFDIQRWAVDARADWRITPDLTGIFSVGRTTAVRGIELTGLGAAQVDNWAYTYYQARANWQRLFVQAYLNTSNAGDTYTLRDGASVVDESMLFVSQAQHGFSLGERQSFTYGLDYFRTMPETGGTIHGRHEDDDVTTEFGGYLQSETALHPMLDLVLAGRVDTHSHLPDPVFSPRAAVVFKPLQNHSLRLTYNQAFNTPRSIDLFLDRHGGPFPESTLAGLGYGVWARGPGTTGFTFRQPDGTLTGMRSPFNPPQTGGPGQLLPANVPTMWAIAVGVLQAQGAFGPPTSPEAIATATMLRGLSPQDTHIRRMAWDVLSGPPPGVPLDDFTFAEIPPLRESNTETLEIGYKGILGARVLFAVDLWRSTRDNFVSALRPVTPLLLLNGQDIAAFLVPRFMAGGMSQEEAVTLAGQLATGMAQIPLGVVSSEEVGSGPGRSDFLVSYRNFGRISYWGSDISANVLLTDRWTLTGMASFVNRNFFESEGQLITMNAPHTKVAGSVAYRDLDLGLNGEVRLRYNAEFPVLSSPYFATACIPDEDLPVGWQRSALEEPCVASFSLVDLTLGYRIPQMRGMAIQLMVQNLLNERYRSFAGVPEIGRMALLRLRYEF